MGGQSGVKGYLLQTLVCLLDALNEDENWVEVAIEPNGESEKVDIAWLFKDDSKKKVQVKHSQLQISVGMATRWAVELESSTDADKLELRLLGPSSGDLTKKANRKIGSVFVPLPQVVNEDTLIAEASHKLNLLISAQTKYAPITPTACELLVSALHLKLEVYSTQGKTISRKDFNEQIASWITELAGAKSVSFDQRVLSFKPRTIRSSRFEFLESRKEYLRRLEQTSGDKLLVGQPGIGKTFLLQEWVKRGNGMFLVRDGEDVVLNAIQAHEPKAVVVEDAHLRVDIVEALQRIRSESSLNFEIVADCWPGGSDKVRQQLNLNESQCFKLAPVIDQDIVDLAKSARITGPTIFLHHLVQQSNGYPGRAALLIDACIEGQEEDFEKFWSGETLARWVRTKISALVGDVGVQLLACFAIGGRNGVETQRVAEALDISIAEVSRIVAGLAMGGVILDVGNDRLAVVPAAIRPVLVRDHFFGIGKIPLTPFLQAGPGVASVVTTLIHSHSIGASISRNDLIELTKKAGDRDTWEAFIGASESNALHVLKNEVDLIPQFSRELLRSAPRQTIKRLLNQAEGDYRPLHSNLSHPLRVLSDWVKSGFPGKSAIPRRKIVFDCYLSESKKNFDSASRLLPFVVSTEYENSETSPGNRMLINLQRGSLTAEDLKKISNYWPRIIDSIPQELSNWKPVLEAVSQWLLAPFRSSNSTSEAVLVVEASAKEILSKLSVRASGRTGALAQLTRYALFHKVTLSEKVDPDFVVLFPKDPVIAGVESYKEKLNRFTESALALGKVWANESPTEVVDRIQFCIDESESLDHAWPDHCLTVCMQISAATEFQAPWIKAIIDRSARSDLVQPFLKKACEGNEDAAFEYLKECLETKTFEWQAVQVALTNKSTPPDLTQLAIIKISPQLAKHLLMLDDLPASTISALLTHECDKVRSSAAEGLWHKHKEQIGSQKWTTEWRKSVVETVTDSYCLKSALQNDESLRFPWLQYWSKQTKAYSIYFEYEVFEVASIGIEESQREILIQEFNPKASLGHHLVPAIVGESEPTYRTLLELSLIHI